MADATALPLQQLVASLDLTCLPRVLQVCCGVYFQGSVYEISGSEVCFSTGDLIKVIGVEPLSVCCQDVSNNEKFELPISHSGLFKVVPKETPYSTIKEMVSLSPAGLECGLPFTFISRSKMTFDNFTLGAGRTLTVLSIERHQGGDGQLRCHIQGQHEASAEVCIPLSHTGEFSECESEKCFTLREIVSSPRLHNRRFRFINTTKRERNLVLTPIYQINANMPLRTNVVKFLSSLEMDVIDVTELYKGVNFASPLSLTEVLSLPHESFPAVVDIVEGPGARSLLKGSWLQELKLSSCLVFHRTGTSAMILISSLNSRKAQQYFLVSQQYGGRFRRRLREFNSVYELYVASIQAPGLKVSVTRNCDEVEEEGLPALSVGDQLEVVGCKRIELPCESSTGQRQSVQALLCQRVQEPDDGDDEEEAQDEDESAEIVLPLHMEGHFVEVLTDNRKYTLADLGKEFSLPMDVKLVSRDTELENDPLVGFACLRIEGAMLEPTVQASFPHRPDHCFEIPTKWLSMSVVFTEDSLPWPSGQPPKCHVDRVTEVTDVLFHEFLKQENVGVAPPPRPPKQSLSSSKSCKEISSKPLKKSFKAKKAKHQPQKSIPTKEFANLTLKSKRRPPAPLPPDILGNQPPPRPTPKHSMAEMTPDKALPNTYGKMEESKKKADVDSDDNYETVDEHFLKKAQETVVFY